MYSCKLTIAGTNSDGESVTKDFAGVNRQYIAQIGGDGSGKIDIDGVALPSSYLTFWEWTDAVARGINSLTTNVYSDAKITAVFNISQEVS